MNSHEKSGDLSKKSSPKERIETQIHRRRKIKVFSPLQIEWDGLCLSKTERHESIPTSNATAHQMPGSAKETTTHPSVTSSTKTPLTVSHR